MFSYIFCKKELPLNSDLKTLNIKWDEIEFQTKDLDNCLDKYIITEDGDLIEEIVEYEYTYYSEEEKKKKDHKPWNIIKEQKIVNQYTKKIDFHGKITFYEIFEFSDTEDIWVDFNAYFIYGKLDKLELLECKKYKSRKNDLNDLFEKNKKLKNSFIYKFKKNIGYFWFFKKLSKLFYNLSMFFSNLNVIINRYFV